MELQQGSYYTQISVARDIKMSLLFTVGYMVCIGSANLGFNINNLGFSFRKHRFMSVRFFYLTRLIRKVISRGSVIINPDNNIKRWAYSMNSI